MLIIRNNLIPFKRYKAMCLWPFLFLRKDAIMSKYDINHEQIHGYQQRELLWIIFILWYCIEWIFRLFQYQNRKLAYRNISFEKEAYDNQHNLEYIKERRLYSWITYLKK